MLKSGFARNLKLQPGEVDAVLHLSSAPAHQAKTKSRTHEPTNLQHSKIVPLLKQIETATIPAELPSPAKFAEVPASDFITFGTALQDLRKAKALQAQNTSSAEHSNDLQLKMTQSLAMVPSKKRAIGDLMNDLNAATLATKAFMANVHSSPIGYLNLERIEMTPAGLEKGELLATVPLAPAEKTTVVQQEWSVISQEFTSIVKDELENFSEKGVTENTELAQATNSQNSHSNQFNITANASGGCGFVSGSVSTSFGSQDQNSQSANDSRKHAQTTTQKASSRAKQSRKVTISSTTVSGSSTTTTRTLENPSSTEVMRVDYFSMMRKWHVGLYRYGVRLTYDLTIPEPGAALLRGTQRPCTDDGASREWLQL
jgi:hypothetical protein